MTMTAMNGVMVFSLRMSVDMCIFFVLYLSFNCFIVFCLCRKCCCVCIA